jgi:multidrug efflux system membrane fusion protein
MNQRRIFIAVAALTAVVLAWLWLRPKAATAGKAPAPVAVDVATVPQADVPVYLEGLGTVQAFYTVTMSARVDGQVGTIGFNEGRDVRKALLAQIDPRPFRPPSGSRSPRATRIGPRLRTHIWTCSATNCSRPRTSPASRPSTLRGADRPAQRAAQTTRRRSITRARSLTTPAFAPDRRRTGIRQVDPGNNVHAADSTGIVVVTQIEPISVIFSLPEEAFGRLSAALQRGPVPAVALSRDGREQLDEGTVALIDNQIDQTTGTLRVKATLPNRQRTLWPGQFVNMRVLVQVQHQVLTIPASAIERGPDGVHVSGAGGLERRRRPIDRRGKQRRGGGGGLKAGERVVASNQYRLQPGSRIRANSARAANGPGTKMPAGAP